MGCPQEPMFPFPTDLGIRLISIGEIVDYVKGLSSWKGFPDIHMITVWTFFDCKSQFAFEFLAQDVQISYNRTLPWFPVNVYEGIVQPWEKRVEGTNTCYSQGHFPLRYFVPFSEQGIILLNFSPLSNFQNPLGVSTI